WLSGLHFHTLCEQGEEDLETTFAAVEERFGDILSKPYIKWLNMGGGHHITKEGYNREALCDLIRRVKGKYDVDVYLEPGEAVALDAGYLVTTVMDVVENGMPILILDASAACHMPDVLEMPYTPPLQGARIASGETEGDGGVICRLASRTCLAGDIIGDYRFDTLPKVGVRLVFEDMAIYSMVKNNTFNGMPLPAIYLEHEDGECELVKRFGYEDFKGRLS
ncbi:MAG: carboxynorspermidine decarboxylase, partial [Lachnospiraceae bacterium]|nr:carboxynorspermidine decarboxylase [Lachnospiraceae bacterium]